MIKEPFQQLFFRAINRETWENRTKLRIFLYQIIDVKVKCSCDNYGAVASLACSCMRLLWRTIRSNKMTPIDILNFNFFSTPFHLWGLIIYVESFFWITGHFFHRICLKNERSTEVYNYCWSFYLFTNQKWKEKSLQKYKFSTWYQCK